MNRELYRCYRCGVPQDEEVTNVIVVGGQTSSGNLIPEHNEYMCDKCFDETKGINR